MSKVVALSMLSLVVLTTFVSSLVMADESLTSAGKSDENGGFKPVVEAPMPEGFPPYTPVGEIQVKSYPAYRKAEASGRTAFWTLFQHIQDAGVSMTAPVEMTYRNDGPPVGREQAMAFLYGDKNTGRAGRQGNVEVVDVPCTAVVSIGLRGERSESAMRQAEQRLADWLALNKERYERTGSTRVMGYNSPFVPRDRQFFEMQIPVKTKKQG